MTPAARSTALLVAAVVGTLVAAFAVAATATFHATGAVLRAREARRSEPRHLKPAEHVEPRRERLMWTVNTFARVVRPVVEFFREDGAPKAALTFACLLVVFSVVIGANQ